MKDNQHSQSVAVPECSISMHWDMCVVPYWNMGVENSFNNRQGIATQGKSSGKHVVWMIEMVGFCIL